MPAAPSSEQNATLAGLYGERHARCMALAREDRRTGNLRAHKHHMEGAASVRQQFARAIRDKRKREAEGYVYLNNDFDCVRLYRNGRMLTADEVRAELSGDGVAA